MFRVMTINLNGIRSAARKGFFHWALSQNADIVAVQELRAQEDILVDQRFHLPGYYASFHCAKKKGYSGVGIYSRIKPRTVIKTLNWELADQEGRYIAVDLGKIGVASIYMPSGTSGEARQAIKYAFLEQYADYLRTQGLVSKRSTVRAKKIEPISTIAIKKTKKIITTPYIICGDFNIAHRPIDLKNWRANQKHSGFLPEERAWLDMLFDTFGFIDAFRVVNPLPEQYTWWSNRGRAFEKNVGWRIDYQVITAELQSFVKAAFIYKQERFSDHAVLIMDYDLSP